MYENISKVEENSLGSCRTVSRNDRTLKKRRNIRTFD